MTAPTICSRQEALSAGKKTYFTGRPCPKGHIAERRVSGFGCVPCGKEQHRNWHSRNVHKATATRRIWAKANPEKAKRASRRGAYRWYGMCPDEAENALKAHDGFCDCCGGSDTGSKRDWSIDHDHKTGKVRGVVCHHCNAMFGYAKDDVKRLKMGIDYLNRGGGK